MLKSHPKLFILGIDGGTFDIIDPMVSAGLLPHLNRVLKDSASARTTCTWPVHTAPGWVSLVSACHPGNHSVYAFFDTQEPNYRARIMGSQSTGCTVFWDWLAAAGLTVGIINVPMSHPPKKLPGYQISWPLANTLRYSYPADLLSELAVAEAHFQSDLHTMFRGEMGYIHEALPNVRARFASLKYLMNKYPVDVVMFVLTEADRVSHHYWQYSDSTHPGFEEPPDPAYKTAIRDIYVELDGLLGNILELLPDECSLSIVSDHGFGPGHSSFNVHFWLEHLGLFKTQKCPPEQSLQTGQASWFSHDGCQVDWDNTKMYMPVPGSFGLNINLKGRQARGAVAPADKDALLKEISAGLAEVKYPASGKPLFQTILRAEEAFPGPHMGSAPDLFLMPADESLMVVGSLEGPLWGRSEQTGLHRYEGMWIHRSQKTRCGRSQQRVRLIDVIPTVLAEMGVACPPTEGRPVTEIFSTPVGQHQSQAGADPLAKHGKDEEWEDADLTRRLRAMGYL